MTTSRVEFRVAAIIVLLAAARLLFAGIIHPTEDEAYYRLWATTAQMGYYDHPPMVAWWIGAGVGMLGDNALGLRFFAVLASSLTSWLVFDLAIQLDADAETALCAVVWYNATLLVGLGGFLMTPDAAATLFWTASLCCLARVAQHDDWRWWTAAGFAAGLACLSKYSALFIAPGVVLWLLWQRGPRALLKPQPWLAAASALAIFGVNVAWNQTHGWMSFGKQFGRVAASHFAPQHLPEFLLTQALLVNPLVCVFAVIGALAVWRVGRTMRELPINLLFALAAPFAAYLCIHSLHDRVQAHWPAPLYPSVAILAAVGASQWVGRVGGVARMAAAPLGLCFSFAVMLHMALPQTDYPGLRDPIQALRGWPVFAQAVESLRVKQGAAWVGALSYGTAAQLQVDGRIKAPVVQVSERQRYPSGDASWDARTDRPGLLVDLTRRIAVDDLRRCFGQVTPLGEVARGPAINPANRYAVYRVSNPTPRLLEVGCWHSKSPFDDPPISGATQTLAQRAP